MNALGFLDVVFITKSSSFSRSGMPSKKFEVFVFSLRSPPRMKIKLLRLQINSMPTFDFYILSQIILAF